VKTLYWLLLLVVFVSLVVLVSPVGAMSTLCSPSPPVDPILPDVQPIEDYVGVIGIGAIITLLIQILKTLNLVPDGQAGIWATAANVGVFAVLWIAGAFGFDVTGSAIQDVLAMLEQLGKLILMVVTSPIFFRVLREARILPVKSE
jgi:hypothetical protein